MAGFALCGEASSVLLVWVVEDQRTIKLRLSLPPFSDHPIAPFRCRSISLMPFFSNTVKTEPDGIG